MTGEQKYHISDLLHRLNSPDAGAAWAKFIDGYSPLILKAVRQFEYEQDRAGECFLYICEKLCDNDFRRLLKFNTGGKASFRTWLGTVVFNLCVDWHRKEFGRAQMLPAITTLPAFDQLVYRLYYEQGQEFETSLHTLRDEFPDLTRQQLSDAIARIHRVLTPRQRWQITVRNRRGNRPGQRARDPEQLPGSLPAPEAVAQSRQDLEKLQEALTHLAPDERLILQLRFHEGLSLKKIAGLMNLGDPFRARRHLQASLDALAAYLHGADVKKI